MGSRGFLGGEIKKYLEYLHKNFITLDTRLNNYDEIKHKLNLYKPKYVICTAGISGKPTISWCDKNKEETFNVNVIDTLKLCEITNKTCYKNTLYIYITTRNGWEMVGVSDLYAPSRSIPGRGPFCWSRHALLQTNDSWLFLC